MMWNQGLYTEAIEHQQEAVRLSGGDPVLMVRLGEMYLAQGDLDGAKHLAQRVIDSGPESAAAYRLRGDVLRGQNRWREALAAYHRALSIEPDNVDVQMAVAQVYQCNGRPQRALSTLQSLAATYSPGEEPAELLYWQGIAFSALGRHRQAIRQFARAESSGMQSADLQFRLAEANHLAGNASAALSALERAMQLDPHHPQAGRLCEAIQGSLQVARARD
jgi:tetratricopeptide (TPR) repeat protein